MLDRAYFFANGRFAISPNTQYRVEAFLPIRNEDWKTALAHNQRTIEVGEQGIFLEVAQNLYGTWARVQFDNVDFSLYTDFSSLKYLEKSL